MVEPAPPSRSAPAPGVSLREFPVRPVWPRLLSTAKIAAAPSRILLGSLLVVVLGLIAGIPRLWISDGAADPAKVAGEWTSLAAGRFEKAFRGLDLSEFIGGSVMLLVDSWAMAFKSDPWSFLAIAVPGLAIAGIIGGAIARSAAETFVGRSTPTGTNALAFALRRVRSFGVVLLAPLVVIGLLYLVNAIAGWAALSIPWVQVVGSVLALVAIGFAALMVALAAAYVVAAPMLPGALACEGTDAIDAVQRVVAYAWSRPGRTLLYGATLLVLGILLASIIGATVGLVNQIAAQSLTVWLPGDKAAYLRMWLISGEAAYTMTINETASLKASGRVLGFCGKVPTVLGAGYLLSFVFSAGSVWYLLMRLVCDGQEPEELWFPSGPVARPDEGGGSAGTNSETGDE